MLGCLSVVGAAEDPTTSARLSLIVSNSFEIKPFNKKIRNKHSIFILGN